jgi:hypothetical protein
MRGRTKNVAYDSKGALNHQLRLGYMVKRLKEQLASYGQGAYEEEIVPLEE